MIAIIVNPAFPRPPRVLPIAFPPAINSPLMQPSVLQQRSSQHACVVRHDSSSAAMVSLAESCRIQRSVGRSVRTVRSNLFRDDPPSMSEPSAAVSENLTDSVVDFQLWELIAGPSRASDAKSVSLSGETPTELLDLSLSFSDYSSFNSDISGELQRLASIAPTEAPPSAAASGPGDVEALGLVPSEVLESASVQSVEPAVRACVEGLASPLTEVKRAAAAGLRLLAKQRSDFRTLIGASGAIPVLVPLLKSADPMAQENAVTALLNLSLEEANKVLITAAGAIKPLVHALRTGTAAAKQNAACALLSLSMAEENRAMIGACGAIPPLVALLVGGTSRGKKDALAALYRLCSARRNKERAVSAGAVPPLVELARERRGGTTEKALVVLGSLAAIPDGKEAMVEAGAIPVLVEAMEAGPPRAREFALHALLQLCADSPRYRGLLIGEGAIPPLVVLSLSGSSSAKHKAATLLGCLREQWQ